MTTRVLSGIIRPLTVGGSARIGYNPHTLLPVGGQLQAGLFHRRTVGPAGDFIRRPAAIVAVRQFQILGNIVPSGVHLFINDTPTRADITITWGSAAGGPVLIEEISYMVIGDVP